MTLLADQIVTRADRLASANRKANLAALARLQPQLALELSQLAPPMEWVFGRDGHLTGRESNKWLSGCSVPLLAARQILAIMELLGQIGCFVRPAHAAQIEACFERLRSRQGIVAIVPDLNELATMLHCRDFAAEIRADRLLFVAGNWASELAKLYETHPGLPIPQQFIRAALSDELLAPFVKEAQIIFAEETQRRTELVARLRTGGSQAASRGRIVFVASDRFDMTDLSPIGMRTAFLGDELSDASAFVAMNPDNCLSASPVTLAVHASEARAVIVANGYRQDSPDIVPENVAWITWVTNGRILPPIQNCPLDGLLLADARWQVAAKSAGWKTDRVTLAGWPVICPLPAPRHGGGPIVLMADTSSLEPPERLKDFSSHGLLWELIVSELKDDPLQIGPEPQRYLQQRMNRLKITAEGFDAALFFEKLILPAYHQGIARILMREGIEISLHGKGWETLPEFSEKAFGPIANPDELSNCVANCSALIHPWPPGMASALDVLEVPVIRPAGLSKAKFVATVRDILAGKTTAEPIQSPRLSRGRLGAIVSSLRWPSANDGASYPD